MRYKVVIERTEVEETRIGKKWELTGPKESAEYGYTPETTSSSSVTRQIFEQVTEDLDLVAVIKAVNKIEE